MEELEQLLIYFQSAKFPEVPFWMNRYLRVHEPAAIISKLESDIRDPKASTAVRESLLVQLRELKQCCEAGPYNRV